MRTDEGRYEAVASRDARFDGAFYVAVTSTGIYCRPSCPAVTPKRANVRFFPTAAAAHGAGFRACRRCRPDAVPGSAEWNVRADVVGRAMRLIGDGVVDREGVAGLAARLGYSARQLHRHLTAEVGAGPLALARAQRAHTARLLLQATALPATEVAFAAGFASVRQFNDTIRTVYAATPSDLRGPRAVRSASPGRGEDGPAGPGGLVVRLGYRRPYAVGEMFDYLARRALRGAEEVIGDRGRRTYRRTLRLTHGPGIAAVAERPGAADDAGWLECRLSLSDLRDLTAAVSRVRRLFDLDADPRAVAERLGADPVLAPLVARPRACAPQAPPTRTSWPCGRCSASRSRCPPGGAWARPCSPRTANRCPPRVEGSPCCSPAPTRSLTRPCTSWACPRPAGRRCARSPPPSPPATSSSTRASTAPRPNGRC